MRTIRYAIVRTLSAATALAVPLLTGVTPAYAASWQVVASPDPAGGRYNDLTGVSGTSASDIWSVGMEFVNSSHSFPIIEHYNGSAWSLVTSAEPAQVGDLEAVAALTPSNAWAVGNGHTATGVNAPMVQHYNGTARAEVPTSVTTAGILSAVTAVSAGNIWAVGSQPVTTGIGRSGLAMHYNGTSWTASPLPAPKVSPRSSSTSAGRAGPSSPPPPTARTTCSASTAW
jgi:hypothetical protein